MASNVKAEEDYHYMLMDYENKALLGCYSGSRKGVEEVFSKAASIKTKGQWIRNEILDIGRITCEVTWNSESVITDENEELEERALKSIFSNIENLLTEIELISKRGLKFDAMFQQKVNLIKSVTKKRNSFLSYSELAKVIAFIIKEWGTLSELFKTGVIEDYYTFQSAIEENCEKCIYDGLMLGLIL